MMYIKAGLVYYIAYDFNDQKVRNAEKIGKVNNGKMELSLRDGSRTFNVKIEDTILKVGELAEYDRSEDLVILKAIKEYIQ